jgi:hypothetical protein
MLDSVLTWTAHSEHQEVWAGPSWSSVALRYDVAFIWSIKPFISQLGWLLRQGKRAAGSAVPSAGSQGILLFHMI